MYFINFFKVSVLSKIFIFDFNSLILIFNNFLLLLNNLVFYNCYFYSSITNAIFFIKKYNFNLFSYYNSRKLNLFYQKKYLNINKNDFYIF